MRATIAGALVRILAIPSCSNWRFALAAETANEAPSASCTNPYQIQHVATLVTEACQGSSSSDVGPSSKSFDLPKHCSTDCAAVCLPWFGDGRGACFTALGLDEQSEQAFRAFAAICRGENGGVDISGASFLAPSDSPDALLVCFDATCDAAPILEQRGAVVLKGCAAGAPLGAVCRLGCTAGFENTADEDGHCALSGVGTVAAYSGQSVACAPEREQNGQMSESYCRMAATEAQLDCCELENADGVVCSADVPPTQCVVACAELWEPLVEDCEQHLADFQELTSECAAVAGSFLAKAASSLSVVGFLCHPDAAGEYQLQDSTVGGKPHWALLD